MKAPLPRFSPALLKGIGRLLALAGVGFVAFEIFSQRESLGAAVQQSSLNSLLVGALVYTVGLLALSLAWRLMLNHYQDGRFGYSESHVSYARSQIAKYLPGNVFHYAGRYALSKAMGASDRAIVSATVEELVGVATVFALCGAVAALFGQSEQLLWSYISLPLLGFIAGAALVVARIALAQPFTGKYRLSSQAGFVLRSWFLFSVFLLLSLSVVVMLTAEVIPLTAPPVFATLVSAFCLSWLFGFLIPGAPGGIGVREAAFLLLLLPLEVEAQALAVILQYRMLTIVGDLLFFCSTYLHRSSAA